jgi:hypothetical protein
MRIITERSGAWSRARTPAILLSMFLASFPQVASAASTNPVWQGNFADFNTPAWYAEWGVHTSDNSTNSCPSPTNTWSCNWGFAGTQGNPNNLVPVADSSAPGGAGALQITYPALSGPPSCACALGGGQFFEYLASSSNPALAALISSTTTSSQAILISVRAAPGASFPVCGAGIIHPPSARLPAPVVPAGPPGICGTA